MNLVFLPATEPDNETYGRVPETIKEFPDASIHTIKYPDLVWYNEAVCNEAISQIRALALSPVVLIGFSKSGLGAWNIARALPDIVAGTIIFDSPVTRTELPSWGTAPFYKDDASWQKDLPILHMDEFQSAMPETHRLVLIAGPGFNDEMTQLSDALAKRGSTHAFLPLSHLEHHWNTGWIEDGLKEMNC